MIVEGGSLVFLVPKVHFGTRLFRKLSFVNFFCRRAGFPGNAKVNGTMGEVQLRRLVRSEVQLRNERTRERERANHSPFACIL